MRGLKSRQRTMTRTRVNASSIISNSFLFPYFQAFRPRGCVYFSAFGKRARKDEGKPETENTLPSGRKIVLSPLPAGRLDNPMASLDLQKGHTLIHGAALPEESFPVEEKKYAAGQRRLSRENRERFSLYPRIKIRPGVVRGGAEKQAGAENPSPRRFTEASRR